MDPLRLGKIANASSPSRRFCHGTERPPCWEAKPNRSFLLALAYSRRIFPVGFCSSHHLNPCASKIVQTLLESGKKIFRVFYPARHAYEAIGYAHLQADAGQETENMMDVAVGGWNVGDFFQ